MNQDIYVVVEHLRGQVADISYVMLAAARVLADGTGGSVVAVLLGHNAQELAEALGGVVCSSRPVVDQGWLPTSRMVGKSGQKVKPKLYLAMGISGAPEHVEAITDSELIIAINTDPNAPIFDLAQYGAEVDMTDLMEVLTELVEEAKGG